ncbi:YrhB domain-containing protein [Streptomyces xantholiticus]
MVERADAVRAVEAHLAEEERRCLAAGADPRRVLRLAVGDVEEHELVWIVQLRSRTPGEVLVGGGPYLVDRVDGGLHEVGAVSWVTGAWEADYRERIRAATRHSAVDELHEQVRDMAAERGRVYAVRLLRQRVPVLDPAQALAYVHALQGGDPSPDLLALAAGALVEPVEHHVVTIRRGKPPVPGGRRRRSEFG